MILYRRRRDSALHEKLHSRNGLTMVELLISLVLMSLLTVGVGIGVSATGPVLNNSIALSESQLLVDTLMRTISSELRYATNVQPLAAGAIPPTVTGEANTFPSNMDFSYTSNQYGDKACIYNSMQSDGTTYVRVMVDTAGYDLVGTGTYSNMSAKVTKLELKTDGTYDVNLQITLPNNKINDYPFVVSPVLN